MDSRLHVPDFEYDIGLCHQAEPDPFKMVTVKADSLHQAVADGFDLLHPSLGDHLRYLATRTNPDRLVMNPTDESGGL